MPGETPGRSLDELAGELEAVVKRAKAATADASLTAELDTMGGEALVATQPIAEAMSVIYDSPQITLKPSAASELDRRRQWLADRLVAVDAQFREDPTKIRRGALWRDTRKAIDQLQQGLFDLRDELYEALLAEYPDDDREQLRSLPPHTTGIQEYARAIDAFERSHSTPPRNPADVASAIAVGERLRDCRARVESEAVPVEFRAQWRQLRGAGMVLSGLTNEFHAWLSARGIEDDVVLRLRS